MERPLVILALTDRRFASTLVRLLEAECWVRTLRPGERDLICEIARRSEPTVLIVDLAIAEESLDLERMPEPLPFHLLVLSPQDGQVATEWLERGADFVIRMPVTEEEVAAQTFSLIRRFSRERAAESESYVFHDLVIDLQERVVIRSGRTTKLTGTEYRLLRTLIEHAGHVVPHARLLSHVWGPEYEGDLPLLRAFILRLRKKLGDTGRAQRIIQTRGQLGYSVPRPALPSGQRQSEAQGRMQAALKDALNMKAITEETRAKSARLRQESARLRAERHKTRSTFRYVGRTEA